jgi:hypothetical protein
MIYSKACFNPDEWWRCRQQWFRQAMETSDGYEDKRWRRVMNMKWEIYECLRACAFVWRFNMGNHQAPKKDN